MHSLTQRITLRVIAVTLCFGGASLGAQARPAAAQSQFKGVFEPVSYTEDIDFSHVFFVTADVGWVAGDNGTIIRTTNGGKTWEAQLGGDPADKAEEVRLLHFFDERRGWAVQGKKMLHTRDGESWEEIGSVPYGVGDIVFTSPRVGYVSGNPSMQVPGSNVMYRTTDGGRSWKPVWTCQAKVAMGGLNQNMDCVFGQIRFPTPQVGYAVARRGCTACGAPPLIAKTTDGGETWKVMTGPGVIEEDEVAGIAFLDERTGFARLVSKKLHMTTDGGATWRGIVASPGEAIEFADPSVGWGIELRNSDLRMSYTTDGGRRWSSREMKLPAVQRAYSLPRRDRAYIVGEHGMIFRYRVIPASQALVANALVAPAMPGFESPLDEQIVQFEQVIDELTEELGSAPTPTQQGTTATNTVNTDSLATADSLAVWSEPFEAPLPPASGFAANCCKKSFSRLEITLGAISQTLPDFISKYKNLNLLLAAIRMGAEMPDEFRTVKSGLRAFRRAQDKESAQAALASVKEALSALKQTTAVSMQQQLPPVPTGMEETTQASFSASSGGNSGKAPESDAAKKKNAATDAANAAKEAAKKEAADKAKKGLGNLLRGRKP